MTRSSLILTLALVSWVSVIAGGAVFAADGDTLDSADRDRDVVAGYPDAPFTQAQVYLGIGYPVITNESTAGAAVTATQNGPLSSATATSSLGSLFVEAHAINSSSNGAYTYAGAVNKSRYTITGGSGQGTVQFTYYLSGTFSGSNLTQNGNGYSVNGTQLATISGNSLVGVLPPQTTTQTRSFTFGQPFDDEASLSTSASVSSSSSQVTRRMDARLLLRSGGYTVMGTPNYTGTSSTGTTRGALFAPSAPYAGFTIQNNVGFGSITTLLDGNASTERNVSIGYIAPMPNFPAVSDIVDIQGTNADPVVIQITYDPLKAAELFGGETALRLAWLNSAAGQWVLATLGNAGGGPQFFNRAYNPATDFKLGNYGLDTATNVVWAVVNHNSEFAVTVVPDPLALASAVSRKTHTGVGSLDIALPTSGPVGVESRRGSAADSHQIVLTFTEPVTVAGVSVTSGTGSVGSYSVNGADVTVNLTGVNDKQILTLGLTNVSNGTVSISPSFSFGILVGDGNGDGTVNSGDAIGTRSRSGQSATAINGRFDSNSDGIINSGDAVIVRARSGNTISP